MLRMCCLPTATSCLSGNAAGRAQRWCEHGKTGNQREAMRAVTRALDP